MPKGRTPAQRKKEMQGAFLEAFPEIGTITHAARAAGIGRRTHYDWLDADPEYAERFRAVQEESTDVLEQVAIQRAKDGSDTLLIFLLKGRKPHMYRERYNVEHTGKDGGPIETKGRVKWEDIPTDALRVVVEALDRKGDGDE